MSGLCDATGPLVVFITIDWHSWKQVYLFFVYRYYVNLRSKGKIYNAKCQLPAHFFFLVDPKVSLKINMSIFISVFYLNCMKWSRRDERQDHEESVVFNQFNCPSWMTFCESANLFPPADLQQPSAQSQNLRDVNWHKKNSPV